MPSWHRLWCPMEDLWHNCVGWSVGHCLSTLWAPSHEPEDGVHHHLGDCFSKYLILIPLKDHIALTVSNALLDWVNPYFGVPRRLLSDRGQEFTGQVWEKLLKALGIQRVLTSLDHPEGNVINEWSHCTMNMLRALLYEGTLALRWVNKIPAIMLTLNSMPHQLHGYSASMIATGRENTLPIDLVIGAELSGRQKNSSACVSGILELLRDVHQWVAPTEASTRPNPYQPVDLIIMGLHPSSGENIQAFSTIDKALLGAYGPYSLPVTYS